MNILDRANVVGALSELLLHRGLRLEVLEDYSRVREAIDFAGKEYLTPFSSPDFNDFTSENCIWMCAYDGDGPVILGAARLEDLGNERLDVYWERTFGRAYRGSEIHNVSSVITNRVQGKIVYFGDLFVAKRARGNRSNLRAFTAIGHMLCSLKWDPDWIYCFLRQRDASRGAAQLYGFNWIEPSPYEWIGVPPQNRSNSEVAAFLSRVSLPGMVTQVLDDLIEEVS
jgi:hypothetical protein